MVDSRSIFMAFKNIRSGIVVTKPDKDKINQSIFFTSKFNGLE